MKDVLMRASAPILGAALTLFACSKPDTSGAPVSDSCGVTDEGRAIDVGARPDGIYAVQGDRLADKPLVKFDRVARTADGVDKETGKRWIGLRLADDAARAMRDFTTEPAGKKIAVIAGGEIASMHKVRQAITSPDLQVSCCNPRACDRWNAILTRPK